MTHPACPGHCAVKRSLTAKRRYRVVENDEYAAFLRRVIRAYSRRVAAGDIEPITAGVTSLPLSRTPPAPELAGAARDPIRLDAGSSAWNPHGSGHGGEHRTSRLYLLAAPVFSAHLRAR